MDFVFPHDMSPGDSVELRYALRSLVNVDHDQVWVSGHSPRWLTNVRHVSKGPHAENKYADSLANVIAVANQPDLSQSFVCMNDDFFAIAPGAVVAVWHRGLVHPKVLAYRPPPNKRNRGAGHRHGLAQTCAVLQRWGHTAPLSYELHLPMVFDKSKLIDVVARARREAYVPALQARTLYGNDQHVGGVEVPDRKISGVTQTFEPDWQWVSTNSASFRTGQVGRDLQRLFPDPSPFETP